MHDMIDFESVIRNFLESLPCKKEYISNEATLQFELGYKLRRKLKKHDPSSHLYFEKNVYSLKSQEHDFRKTEIDLSIISKVIQNGTPVDRRRCAIELKFPRNKQYPEEMFMFVEDIKFLEELIKTCHFEEAYAVVVVDDPLFVGIGDRLKKDGIYGPFRNHEELKGKRKQPTKAKKRKKDTNGEYIETVKDPVELARVYKIEWKPLSENLWYYVLAIHEAPYNPETKDNTSR